MPYWRAMNLVTQRFAIVAVLFHVVAFVLESFLFRRPNVQTISARQAGTVGWGTPLGVQPGVLQPVPRGGSRRWARCAIRRESERRSSARYLRLRLHGCVRRRTVHFRPPVVAEHDRPERTAAHRPHRVARVAPTDRVQLRQVVHGTRMDRADNAYTYIPASKVVQ